jgi:hypothetical protein
MDESTIEAVGPDQRTYQQYLDERKLLIESERAAAEGFDKTLLTLSAGAIALSVTFVEARGGRKVQTAALRVVGNPGARSFAECACAPASSEVVRPLAGYE